MIYSMCLGFKFRSSSGVGGLLCIKEQIMVGRESCLISLTSVVFVLFCKFNFRNLYSAVCYYY